MKNKYVKRGKISEAKFRQLVHLFSLDLTAVQITDLTNLNRNTVNRYLKGIRQRIAEYCEVVGPPACRLHEQKSNDGPLVAGLICRDNKIHLGMFPFHNINSELLEPSESHLNQQQISELARSFHALYDPKNEWKYYISSVEAGTEKLNRTSNRIDGFIGFTRSRLQKFKGLKRDTLYLHLKECEFRYNENKDEYYHLLLKILRNNPLF